MIIAVDKNSIISELDQSVKKCNLSILRELRLKDHEIILWDSLSEKETDDIQEDCAEHDMYFDAVNNNTDSALRMFNGTEGRKIYADIYVQRGSYTKVTDITNKFNLDIAAIDFDGTLVDIKFPKIGAPKLDQISALRTLRINGCKLILWTCRVDTFLNEAVEFMKNRFMLEFDSVNSMPLSYGDSYRKVVADVFIDDKTIPSLSHPAIRSLLIGDNN